MLVHLIDVSTDTLTFKLTNTTLSFANALRRVLLSEIPTITIDLVEIEKNNTVLPDELIAHRLGLIPLYSSSSKLKYASDCGCTSNCTDCSIVINLNVANTEAATRLVTARDFSVEDREDVEGLLRSRHPPVIAKLSTNQSLKARCICRRNRAAVHAKWSPVTVVGFEYDELNRRRDTCYWYESDIEKEWPGHRQGEPALEGAVDAVTMCVEVVEGCMEPFRVVGVALGVLKEKVGELRSLLESE